LDLLPLIAYLSFSVCHGPKGNNFAKRDRGIKDILSQEKKAIILSTYYLFAILNIITNVTTLRAK